MSDILDEHYSEGVFFDHSSGEYFRFDEDENNVLILNPETRKIVHKIPKED